MTAAQDLYSHSPNSLLVLEFLDCPLARGMMVDGVAETIIAHVGTFA